MLFIKLATPAALTNLLTYGTLTINTAIAGRMDDPTKLAGVGLANMCQVIMILSLLTGLNAAQETLTSQAFGQQNSKLCGIYLNRGRLILVCFFIPLALMPAIFAENIFLALGQDPGVSKVSHTLILWGLPSVFC